MKSTVSTKGQITLPLRARESLGLTPGTPVDFEIVAAGVLVKKGVRGRHPVDRVYGMLKSRRRSDAIVDELRGPRR